ncbi:hypothetical protein OSB04_018490 [Centaurea solstitialis]|uniref:Uncharacterized protein n=1 Tax=Centaurea solstitialis TaxID=347529 RepID=A0AA38T4X9_9ASTR|nr:hypothetical protein OSB04_018490 [Centaurea solstitialis]
MPRKARGEFFELDPEIEQTLRWQRKVQKDLLKTIQMLNQQEENPPPHPSDDEEEYSDEEELYQEQDIIQLANSKDGGIMDYAIPVLGQLHSGILRPKIKAAHCKLIIISNNCPPLRKSEIEYYAMLVEDHHYIEQVVSYVSFDSIKERPLQARF